MVEPDADHILLIYHMKKFATIFFSMILSLLFIHTQAQIESGTPLERVYKGFYLGAHGSTNGFGLNASYSFNKWLSVKTGYETLSLKYNFNFDELDIEYNANLNYKTGGILLLADLSYTRNLYISTGLVFNSFNPQMEGLAISDYAYGDITIPAEKIGSFEMGFEPGLKASPYIAAGFRGFMGKAKRLVFNFETGMYYMGAPDIKITSEGLLAPTSDPLLGQEELLENQFSAYKIYPVIKINLGYRIF